MSRVHNVRSPMEFSNTVNLLKDIDRGTAIEFLWNRAKVYYDFVMIFATIAILLGVEIWQSKVGSVREQIDKANIVVRYTVWLVLILSIIIFGAYGVTYQAVAPMYALY